jgi:hypothetical protein
MAKNQKKMASLSGDLMQRNSRLAKLNPSQRSLNKRSTQKKKESTPLAVAKSGNNLNRIFLLSRVR